MAGEREREQPASLRVALVCPYSLSRPGGVQGQVVGLARALERRGHRSTIFAPLDTPRAVPSGVEVIATGRSVALPANGSRAPVTLSLIAVTGSLRTLRAGGFDVVHVHEPFAPGLPYGLLLDRRLPPVVATFHRSGASGFYRGLRPLTSRLARRLALRCSVSEAATATASEAVGGSFELSFNGVEVDRFEGVEPSETDGPTVLFLGRHEERKGLAVLLDAFERLRGLRPSLPDGEAGPVLWIAGDGPETEALRRRHPEAPDLRWLGVLSEEEKLKRLTGARVLCAPSLGGESFGMVLLEAMAARTLVVASDIPGYRDAAGGHAMLAPPGDAQALAETLSRLVEPVVPRVAGDGDGRRPAGEACIPMHGADEALRDAGAWLDAAFAWASHWSMDRLAEWYEQRYRSVMAGPVR